MIINEIRELIDKIDETHPELSVRLVLGVSIDSVNEVDSLMSSIKEAGYASNLQSSAYGDIEVVVTDADVRPS